MSLPDGRRFGFFSDLKEMIGAIVVMEQQ